MPQPAVLVAMAAQRSGLSASDYFHLRTRQELMLDVAAWQSSFTAPLLMVASSLGLLDKSSEPPPQDAPPYRPGQDRPEPAPRQHRRDRTRPPRWYRQVDGRSYAVHDMDTQDARRFAARAEHLKSQWAAIGRWHLGEWASGKAVGLSADPQGTQRLQDLVALRKARRAATAAG